MLLGRPIGSNNKMTPKRYFEKANTTLACVKQWKKEHRKVYEKKFLESKLQLIEHEFQNYSFDESCQP